MAGWTSIWQSGFSNSEELNEAWHNVAGYGQVLSSAEMTALVHQHPELPRVAPTLTDHSSLDQQRSSCACGM